jgi:hypothetical protein
MEFFIGLFLLFFGALFFAILCMAMRVLFWVVLAAIGVKVFNGITK